MKTYITVESKLKGSDESWGMAIGYPVDAKGVNAAMDAAFDYIRVNEKIHKNIDYRIGEKRF